MKQWAVAGLGSKISSLKFQHTIDPDGSKELNLLPFSLIGMFNVKSGIRVRELYILVLSRPPAQLVFGLRPTTMPSCPLR